LGRPCGPGARRARSEKPICGFAAIPAFQVEASTYFHAVGTCRMGREDARGAVVDAPGRVRGVGGLWVVDASIMPTIPAANTNIPTIVVAERCEAWLGAGGAMSFR